MRTTSKIAMAESHARRCPLARIGCASQRKKGIALRKAFPREPDMLSLLHAYQGRLSGGFVSLAGSLWIDPLNALAFILPARLVKAHDLFRNAIAATPDRDADHTCSVE